MRVAPSIFREYDVRGRIDGELTPEAARLIGRAFGSEMRRRGLATAVAGRDVRPSSPALLDAVVGGLRAAGIGVTTIGQVTTPMVWHANLTLPRDAGVMVTGSHNPPEFNGIKLALGAAPFFGEDVAALRSRIEADDFASGSGAFETRDHAPAYLADVRGRVRLRRPLTVALDCGNGVAGPFVAPLLAELGCTLHPLYLEPDGRFPNHLPDPEVPEYVRDLIAEVRRTGADVGLGFDGDGDRVGVVDETGVKWGADRVLILLARDVLRRHPGGVVRYDVKCTDDLEAAVRAAGGEPVMGRTGHSILKRDVRELGAVLGGELSGHIVFGRDYLPIDDALYAALRVLEIVAGAPGPLSARLADLPPRVSTAEIKVRCPDEAKFRVVEAVRAELESRFPVVAVDGARVRFPDGWGLVRASNTTPVLTVRLEARDAPALERIRAELRRALARHGEVTIGDLDAGRDSHAS